MRHGEGRNEHERGAQGVTVQESQEIQENDVSEGEGEGSERWL